MLISNQKQVNIKGFTLTEVSIVIVIIAFLVSAILKGQNLISEAKLQSVVSEVSTHQVAVNSFYTKYTKYPGDFNEAVAYWGASKNADGDNNGHIEFKNTAGTPVYEGFRLWQQLSYAGMETSPYLGTATTSAPVLVTDIPASRSGGGYIFDYSSSATAYDAASTNANAYGFAAKNVMLLGVPAAAVATKPVQVSGTLTPSQAMGIDAKMDDGVPTTGGVRGADGKGATAGNCISGAVYNISLSGKDCIMIFKTGNQ